MMNVLMFTFVSVTCFVGAVLASNPTLKFLLGVAGGIVGNLAFKAYKRYTNKRSVKVGHLVHPPLDGR